MGLFSSKKTISTSTTRNYPTTKTADQRTSVAGGAGGVASPDAALAQSGIAVSAQPHGWVKQTIGDLTMGLSGAEVRTLLEATAQAQAQQVHQASQLASSAIGALGMTKAADPVSLTRYVPYVIGAVVLMVFLRGAQ